MREETIAVELELPVGKTGKISQTENTPSFLLPTPLHLACLASSRGFGEYCDLDLEDKVSCFKEFVICPAIKYKYAKTSRKSTEA